ncbi:MAG: hypothetical protein ACFFC1_05635, partial [Promethearchaeota archaeon]
VLPLYMLRIMAENVTIEKDIFALVALDSKIIAYLPNGNMKTTMNFRVPSLKGTYYDERGIILKKKIIDLRNQGLTCEQISKQEKLNIKTVYRYSADVDITPKGNNNPIYFNEFTLEKCLEKLNDN